MLVITLLFARIARAEKDCIGAKFIEFAGNYVPDTDPPIPYQFKLIEEPNNDEIYKRGTTFDVCCDEGMYFAYPWSSKSLICDNGEIKQDDVSKYNHCISDDQCSAAYFEYDWVIDGYRLHSKINNLLEDGPLITKSISFFRDTLDKYGKQYPNNILSKYSDKSHSHNTYPPLLLLTCDVLYTSFNINPSADKPHAYCIKKAEWKKAKWSIGSSNKKWRERHSLCRKIIINLSIKKGPPPQGCSVLSESRSECIAYKKYCAWDELQKFKGARFDRTKVDIRICTQQCCPWSCYSALTMPIDCEEAGTERRCSKLIPAYTYWCEWDREEQICVSKKIEKESKDYPIQTDICSTNHAFCRASEDEDYWDQNSVVFSGAIKSLNGIQFGYKYKIFGIRHVVQPLSLLSEMRGSVITSIRATHEINEADPTQLTLDAAVMIEPNSIKRKFGVMTRKKYQILSSLFNLEKRKEKNRGTSRKFKPSPDYEYVSIELKSDELDKEAPPISFYLSTYTSTDCKRCKLEKYKSSAFDARINTITNVLYVVDIANPSEAVAALQFPSMDKANKEFKMKVTIQPGPERCGKNDIGCFVILQPIMNEAFSSIFKIKCKLPIYARLAGYDDSVLTVFGAKPSKRKKVSSKYSMKAGPSKAFLDVKGQSATLRWSVAMGLVKSIFINADNLAEYKNVVQQPVKIEFKTFDKLKTRPDKTKWVLLTAKKTMPTDCKLQYQCNLCGVEIGPSTIRIRKGFKRLRLRITARIPGEFQIHFTVTGNCANLVSNPPSLLMEVFQPNAGFVRVPETLGPILNNEWSEEFDISITRPPFRTELKIKPLTNEFATDPLEIRFDNIKYTMIQETAGSLSRNFGITNDETIKIMPSLECGGGPPKELRWTLSGAIEEFYAPHPTFVTVQSTDTDDDYCKYKQYKALVNSSNGTNISFAFMNMNEKEFTETPQIAIPEWRFEYYLIGGAITICMLVVINQFKEQKLDRIIAIMSGALQT